MNEYLHISYLHEYFIQKEIAAILRIFNVGFFSPKTMADTHGRRLCVILGIYNASLKKQNKVFPQNKENQNALTLKVSGFGPHKDCRPRAQIPLYPYLYISGVMSSFYFVLFSKSLATVTPPFSTHQRTMPTCTAMTALWFQVT